MPGILDVRELDDDRREAFAARIKVARDFDLPTLAYWNYANCREHRHGWVETVYAEDGVESTRTVTDRPKPGCRKCGIHPRRHQRVGIPWLYIKKRGLLADSVGPQPLDAQVLTPTGFVSMGSLHIGDALIDPAGSVSRVDAIHDRGVQDVYRITFSDGTTAESTLSHLWKTRGEKSPYLTRVGREPRDGIRWTVETLADIQKYRRARAVPLLQRVPDFVESALPLDPYLVGVLLGDGSLGGNTPHFINDESDIQLLRFLEELLPAGVTANRVKGNDRCPSYSLSSGRNNSCNPLTDVLRELDMCHTAYTKFVPLMYKVASAKTRLAVLQGLMDTDGWWEPCGGAFSSSSKQLRDDVSWLARSLGFMVRDSQKPGSYRDGDGTRVDCAESYRSTIADTSDLPLFRLSRKLKSRAGRRIRGDLTNAGVRAGWQRRQPVKWIRAVEFSRTVPVQCIEVSATSQLYVTDDFTITHNTGKTIMAGGLIAILKETGEMDEIGRVLIVCRSPALLQWQTELERMLPGLSVAVASGTRRQRVDRYLAPWDVLLIGPQMLLNDVDGLMEFPLCALIVDDVDALRNRDNRTAIVLKRIGRRCERMIVMTGTPLQKRLHELHSVLEPLGGLEIFGSEAAFMRRYVRSEQISIYNPRTGRRMSVRKIVGYKNISEFKRLIFPLALRRTAADIDDVELPAVIPSNIELELYKLQRDKYEELRQDVVTIMATEGETIKQATGIAKLHYGAQICGGLATLGEADGPGRSVKLDWLMDKIGEGGDLEEEKVVVFMAYKASVRAFLARMDQAGIDHFVFWGEESDKMVRAQAVQRFWEDPKCRVLVGTQAIEQSLNLQVARHLVNFDMVLNPARMEQLAGRIRRDGSAFTSVYVHNLLTVDTQEAGYLALLEREQALVSSVWEEESELFESLSPLALLSLISG